MAHIKKLNTNSNMSKTSISDDNIYPVFCHEAATNDQAFKMFRSSDKYKVILEHVTEREGRMYLNLVERDNPQLLDNIVKYKTNDSVGSPTKFQYDGNVGAVSPTTLRYIKVLSDLVKEFGNLDGLDIVEIGCGYGGQAKIIMDTFNVKSYTLIDLKPVLGLTERYLTAVGVDISKLKFLTMEELPEASYDLFISNYAYSECNKAIQKEYYDKVLSKSKMGYITANFINSVFNLDYHTKAELLSMFTNSYTLPEEPSTHPYNIIILWK